MSIKMSPYYLSYEKSYDHKLIKRESLTLLIQEHQAFCKRYHFKRNINRTTNGNRIIPSMICISYSSKDTNIHQSINTAM